MKYYLVISAQKRRLENGIFAHVEAICINQENAQMLAEHYGSLPGNTVKIVEIEV